MPDPDPAIGTQHDAMTANESIRLAEEAAESLQPVLERFQSELFEPIVNRLPAPVTIATEDLW